MFESPGCRFMLVDSVVVMFGEAVEATWSSGPHKSKVCYVAEVVWTTASEHGGEAFYMTEESMCSLGAGRKIVNTASNASPGTAEGTVADMYANCTVYWSVSSFKMYERELSKIE